MLAAIPGERWHFSPFTEGTEAGTATSGLAQIKVHTLFFAASLAAT